MLLAEQQQPGAIDSLLIFCVDLIVAKMAVLPLSWFSLIFDIDGKLLACMHGVKFIGFVGGAVRFLHAYGGAQLNEKGIKFFHGMRGFGLVDG